MRTVDIRNLREARVLHPYYDAVVSVLEDGSYVKSIGEKHPKHIVEVMGDYSKSHTRVYADDWLPAKEQFERILKFVNTLPENAKILVHCAAGISRSTATGLMILVNEGWEPEMAVKHLRNKHPENRAFWPNDLILSYADEILGSNLEDTVYTKRSVDAGGNKWPEWEVFPVTRATKSLTSGSVTVQ